MVDAVILLDSYGFLPTDMVLLWQFFIVTLQFVGFIVPLDCVEAIVDAFSRNASAAFLLVPHKEKSQM